METQVQTSNSEIAEKSTAPESAVSLRDARISKRAVQLRKDGWAPEAIIELLAPHAENLAISPRDLQDEVEHICRHQLIGNTSLFSPLNREKTETELAPYLAVLLEDLLMTGSSDIEWLVDQILPKEGLAILGGLPGLGKTWLLKEFAIACSLGEKWLGHFATTPTTVLYLDEESGNPLLRKRFTKLLQAKNCSPEGVKVRFVVQQGLSLSDPKSLGRLRLLLATLKPGLVIIDSLIRVHHADENSASEMSKVFEVLRSLMKEFGCAFLIADHERKPGPSESHSSMQLRGSTDKVASVDSLLSLHSKSGALMVEHSKSRFGEPVPPFMIEIKDSQDNKTTTVAYLGETETIKLKAKKDKFAEARDFLLSHMNYEDWISRKELVNEAEDKDLSDKIIDEALKVLKKKRRIEREDRKPETGRGGKSAHYRLKPNTSPSLPYIGEETETELVGW